MVREAVKSYVGLAVSVGTLTRQRALAAAKTLVSSGEATAEQVGSIADDLLATSKANREAVAGLVRVEVERALGRLGLATAEDVRGLTARLAAVEAAARTARPAADAAGSAPASAPVTKAAKPAKPARAAKPSKPARPARAASPTRAAGTPVTTPGPKKTSSSGAPREVTSGSTAGSDA